MKRNSLRSRRRTKGGQCQECVPETVAALQLLMKDKSWKSGFGYRGNHYASSLHGVVVFKFSHASGSPAELFRPQVTGSILGSLRWGSIMCFSIKIPNDAHVAGLGWHFSTDGHQVEGNGNPTTAGGEQMRSGWIRSIEGYYYLDEFYGRGKEKEGWGLEQELRGEKQRGVSNCIFSVCVEGTFWMNKSLENPCF